MGALPVPSCSSSGLVLLLTLVVTSLTVDLVNVIWVAVVARVAIVTM
jgi:hypothetical protein